VSIKSRGRRSSQVSGDPSLASNQQQRFIETARQLGADEDEAAFKAKLAQIARQKVKGDVPAPDVAERADGVP